MRIASQTEIANVDELTSELSALLEGEGSLWSVELEIEEADPDVDCGCAGHGPDESPSGKGKGKGRKEKPSSLCQFVTARIFILCKDNGCRQTGGICVGQVVQPPKLRCVCVRPKK